MEINGGKGDSIYITKSGDSYCASPWAGA